jgi:hypothetical protein
MPILLVRWLPGLGFAMPLLLATRLWKQFWVMPLTLLACAASFFGVLWIVAISVGSGAGGGMAAGAVSREPISSGTPSPQECCPRFTGRPLSTRPVAC